MRMLQTAIFIAVAWINIYFSWASNPYIVAGWAVIAAYVLTVAPFQVVDWWRLRDVRREEYLRKKAAGIPYGWRRHLPWNAKKPC